MAGTSTSFSPSSVPQKICLFCLGPADYLPAKASNGSDWTKTYFRQFLWKYLIGDDQVKINEFTGNLLKDNVPPMCSACHDKCRQLASYHLEFEKVQDKIMQVARDLLDGKQDCTKAEYDVAAQNVKDAGGKSSSRAPANRFIKSSGGNNQLNSGVFPSYETIQMYQILRNPGHVRIPLSCLKSFSFSELKNLITKNSTMANKIIKGTTGASSLPKPSLVPQVSPPILTPKAGGSASLPKRYWINDVQVEMVGADGSNVEDDEEEEVEPEPEPIPKMKMQPKFSIIPMASNKRPKMERETEIPDEVEYYDEEDATDNNLLNFLKIVPQEDNYDGEEYDEDAQGMDDSRDADNEDSQY
ncbi:hypothetical protein Ocin01_08439, partial [Orchesella cincta]